MTVTRVPELVRAPEREKRGRDMGVSPDLLPEDEDDVQDDDNEWTSGLLIHLQKRGMALLFETEKSRLSLSSPVFATAAGLHQQRPH